jgi:hypothetical protein
MIGSLKTFVFSFFPERLRSKRSGKKEKTK